MERRSWSWLLGFGGTVLIVLALGVLMLTHRPRPKGDDALSRIAAQRAPRPGRADAEGLHLRARSLARTGAADAALALYADAGAGPFEAEDLFLLGRALQGTGRTVLGWAAFEAASKLDPSHGGAAAALAELHGRIETLGAVADQADRLAAVPSGAALAELVVGLAAAAPANQPPGDFDPVFERALRRDRAELLGLDGPAAADKLLARLFLETGRPAAARAWLARRPELRDDREAYWLLSRAYLQAGDIDQASAAVGRSDGFGDDRPLAHEPAPFVGTRRCVACHGTIARAQQTSRHAATAVWGPELKDVPLPGDAVADPEEPGVTHRFERNGEEIHLAVNAKGQALRALIAYALGSGHQGVTMLAREPSGVWRQARLSYYPAGDAWDLTSGFNPHPSQPAMYLGEPLSAEGLRKCLNCHTTRFDSEHDRGGPEAADKGIGCERCHGPGDHHLRAMATGFPQWAIARPKLASPAQRLKLCAQCHGADGAIPPSDPRFVRFQATTFPYSRCVTESGGRLDCVACHDPHRNREIDPVFYEARCRACHGGPAVGAGGPLPLRFEPVPARACPVNAASGCLDCHMPKVDKTMPFTVFTDHHVRIHLDAPARSCR